MVLQGELCGRVGRCQINSAELGPQWTQKKPGVFRIADQQVVGTGTAPLGISETLAYVTDDLQRDIEISTEFTIDTNDFLNEPMLALRVQPSSLTSPPDLEAYVLVAGGEDPPEGNLMEQDSLCIHRQFGGFGPVAHWCVAMTPPDLDTGFLYRMTFSSTGIDPVVLSGSLERRDPLDDNAPWESIAQITEMDESDDRIGEAGAYGLSGGDRRARGPAFYRYDNFTALLADP